jgi:group I intron endonuclease
MNNIKSGVYQIRNIINNKFYIGSTIYFNNRKSDHFRKLNTNKHDNPHLQRAWDKYGEENFEFNILEYVEDKEKLIEREQYWLDKTQCYNPEIGYNIRKVAESNLGLKHTDETKEYLRKINMGNTHGLGYIPTEETRKKLSMALTGKKKTNVKPMSEETKVKISQANKGKKRTEEHKKQQSERQKGKKLSDETRKKMSESKMGNTSSKGVKWSEESRIKFSEIRKDLNLKWTKEQKKFLSESRLGDKSPVAKLTEKEVIEIKKLLLQGIGVSEIAKMFKVTPSNISCIKHGKSWSHVIIDEIAI